VLGRAPWRQRLEHRSLDGRALGRTHVEALHDLLDEQLVAGAVVEAARATQTQRLVERGLQRVVTRLDSAVLVRLARVGAHA
jgi:hypothetical protein